MVDHNKIMNSYNKILAFEDKIKKDNTINKLKQYWKTIDGIIKNIKKARSQARSQAIAWDRYFINNLIIEKFITNQSINIEICKNICISYCLYYKITLYDLVCLFFRQNDVAKDRIANILKSIDENTDIKWGNKLYIWIMLNQLQPIKDILENNDNAEKQITKLVSNNNALSLAVNYNVDTNILEYLVSKINDNDKSKWLNHMYTSYHRYNTLLDIANLEWLTNNNALTSKQLYGKSKGILSNEEGEEGEDAYEQKYREIFPSYEYNGNIIKPSPFLLACLYEFTADIEKFIDIDPVKYGNAKSNYIYGGIVNSITIINFILREPQLWISFKTIIGKWSEITSTWEENKKIIKKKIILKFETNTENFFEWGYNGKKTTAITDKKYNNINFKLIIAIAVEYDIINQKDIKIFINGSDNEHTNLTEVDKKKWKLIINEYLPDTLKIKINGSTEARYTQYLYKNQ